MTFPPSRLTKAAWTKIMDDLSNHFGDDATLDAKKVDHIKAYLLSEALDRKNDIRTKMRLKAWAKKGIVDPIRIVDTPEWIGEHKSNRFRTMQQDVGFMGSNCSKCHLNGERGQYESFKDRYPD
jgi:hypothetical protein